MSEIRAKVSEQSKKNLEQFCYTNRIPSISGKGSLPSSQGAALTHILANLDKIPPMKGVE